MIAAILFTALVAHDLKAPKQPAFGIIYLNRVRNVFGADQIFVTPEAYREELPQWVRLYGVDVPTFGQRGASGATQDLEILLGRSAEVYVEDENEDHPVVRHAMNVQYVWAWGKLIEFELVKDGWATVNKEGRKGKYGKFLTAAEDEARVEHLGIWAR